MRIRYVAQYEGRSIGDMADVDALTAHKLAASRIAEYADDEKKPDRKSSHKKGRNK